MAYLCSVIFAVCIRIISKNLILKINYYSNRGQNDEKQDNAS